MEQGIGRIFRKFGDIHKLICDVIDENIECFNKQSTKRIRLYKKKGYEIYLNDNDEN